MSCRAAVLDAKVSGLKHHVLTNIQTEAKSKDESMWRNLAHLSSSPGLGQ